MNGRRYHVEYDTPTSGRGSGHLSPFEEDFYLPEGAPAWLVEKTGPVAPTHQEFTLAQARADF